MGNAIRLAIACYIVSCQLAMLVFLVAYHWQEDRFGFRHSARRYASITDAALDGIAEAGSIVLRAIRWPYFAWKLAERVLPHAHATLLDLTRRGPR